MRVKGWHPATGEVELDVDPATAAMVRAGQVTWFSIGVDPGMEPGDVTIVRTHPGQRLRPFAPVTRFVSDEQMEDWDPIVLTNPAGKDVLMGHVQRPQPIIKPVDGLIPPEPPAADPMDVTWPDQTFKVFPDRTEWTVAVEETFLDGAGIWSRIIEEVHRHRLEQTTLEELAAIITERGKDAPGLLIIQTPDGQWAVKETEWVGPGSVVLSRMDVPDLMTVAQDDGWLYYRSATRRVVSRTPQPGEFPEPEPEEVHVDIMPTLPDWATVHPCPDCGGDTFSHRAGCINE